MVENIKTPLEKMTKAILQARDSKPSNQLIPAVVDDGLCNSDCACGGLGYVRKEREIGDPLFGTLELCSGVDKFALPGATRYGLTRDEIVDMFWYSHISDRKQAEPAIKAVQGILAQGHGWLYIWGSYGLAKTVALKAAVAHTLRDGGEAAYIRMAQILDDLRDGYSSDDPRNNSAARLDWWANVPLLAIDEFDRFRPTEYAQERQFMLMDSRYDSAIREQSITIIASNQEPDMLDGYILDRIEDGRFQVLGIKGESKRPEQKWKR